jgi:XTP/dITP diphosphohydrolase
MKIKNIYYITGNESKFKEASEILKNTGINLIKKDLEIKEIKSLNQELVVINKARQAFLKLKKPLIVDDVGIYFKAYNKFPGTFTRYLFEAIGFEGIEKLLFGKNRKAFFKILLCYKDEKSEIIFKGILNGNIIKNIKKNFNKNWQYDNIFIPENFNASLSEIPINKRAKFSHRKKAFNKFIKWVKGGNK